MQGTGHALVARTKMPCPLRTEGELDYSLSYATPWELKGELDHFFEEPFDVPPAGPLKSADSPLRRAFHYYANEGRQPALCPLLC